MRQLKELMQAFTGFSRIERVGFAVFSIILTFLTILLATMRLWVKYPDDAMKDGGLSTTYDAWKMQEARLSARAAQPEARVARAVLFPFDPNSLDSAGFIRLGMPPMAVRGLLAWRRKGKRFYRPDDLRPLYNLPAAEYERLAPYISIRPAQNGESPTAYRLGEGMPQIPALINLNTADSALLDRGIRGIGPTLARKIIARRNALGGFLKHEQLLEIYQFPDSTFQHLKQKLTIDAGIVRKIGLNSANLERLSMHPYIGEKTARNILLYREGIGRYARLEQLREVPLMSEEIYRKIAPYITID